MLQLVDGELQGSARDFATLSVGQLRMILATLRVESREHHVHGMNHAEVEHLTQQFDILVGLAEDNMIGGTIVVRR